ncbi:Nudix family hydrolase [Alcanivorax sp. 1008]|uniref:Nudix family hydrolase n=1 Tax=Alcanivorax sp. 1008 TaxID=2816853 RepID=UPI001E3C14AD|nr:Nudix family hydrolase [Alcanivorax sp. 1008]
MPELMPRLDVVAAIIRDAQGRVLLAQRPAHKHQGGRWEFPGGKVEAGEALDHALARELDEELGLTATDFQPFMTVDHRYPELQVRLHFREVKKFQGLAHGREGQPVNWFTVEQMRALEFPAANRPVVKALQLSDTLLVMPDSLLPDWSAQLHSAIDGGCRVIYLRGLEQRTEQLQQAVNICRQRGALSLVRNDVAMMQRYAADGLHLSAAAAGQMAQRPQVAWLSVACHSAEELQVAQRLEADLVLLSPVLATASHPEVAPLGWSRFAGLATGQPFAVYALGGMTPADVTSARHHGARGIAAIRAFF